VSLLRVTWLSLMEGEVVVDLGLGGRPGSLGLARPRSFEPLLADILWATWLAS
jgi:hypothetical protein